MFSWIVRRWEKAVGWDDMWGMERGMAVSGTLVVLLLVVAGAGSWAGWW